MSRLVLVVHLINLEGDMIFLDQSQSRQAKPMQLWINFDAQLLYNIILSISLYKLGRMGNVCGA